MPSNPKSLGTAYHPGGRLPSPDRTGSRVPDRWTNHWSALEPLYL